MVRDTRRSRAPLHEGLKPHPEEGALARLEGWRKFTKASTGSGVAVGKAAGQCQPDPGAPGVRGQLQLRAAARGAASHVSQAARRILAGRAGHTAKLRHKTLAVVLD